MERKDITPNNQNPKKGHNSLVSGILGGVVGGAVLFGVLYFSTDLGATNNNNTAAETTTSGIVDSSGNTAVSQISYDVESDTTNAVEKVQDAVVSVVNLQKLQESNNPFGDIFGSGSSSGDTTEDSTTTDAADLEAASEGSGVIYKKEGNTAYVVTNNHVVEGQDGLQVLLADGTTVTAELVGTDSYTDLAVLKIPAEHVTKVAEFGDSDALKVGEPAIAIGSPLGSDYANSVTQGIISSLNREIDSTNESGEPVNINAIQTDAAINPGNSGGPLINAGGQVVGINSIKITDSNSEVTVEGLGFAIPSNDVVTIINQLEADGTVARPVLGIQTTELANITTQQREQILGLTEDIENGVVVVEVQNATPAEKAGLQQYDVIVKADDTDIDGYSTLTKLLKNKKIGDTVTLEVYRGDEKKTIEVELTLDGNDLTTDEATESSN
ncbi:S1C family serine protease [Enterococcus timonensis]|uniref:S1C family serine protease n=1 Tax=Enterococcus timonensis TaxID=1852364 RepID=UPI0008DB1C33|nr:trypsin-like peptidase domain-containing protein [Enterococcus timonensis]